MADVEVQAAEDGVTLRVWVKPRASRSQVLGARDGCLEVAVAAPPVDGAANDELRKTLARHFKVSRGAVSVEAGKASRTKLVRIRGVSISDALAKIGAER
jgi:uncharacterized protein (TIGR00251 family)